MLDPRGGRGVVTGGELIRRAVVFGAGNIGRGFLGQLLWESGYTTTFVEVLEPLVEALNTRGEPHTQEVCALASGDPLRNLILSATERLSGGLGGDGLDLDQHVER